MSENHVLKNISSVMQEKLGVEEEQITPNARLMEDLGADSLDAVEVIMALEDKFETRFSDVGSDKLTTVNDVVNYVTRHIDTNRESISE